MNFFLGMVFRRDNNVHMIGTAVYGVERPSTMTTGLCNLCFNRLTHCWIKIIRILGHQERSVFEHFRIRDLKAFA